MTARPAAGRSLRLRVRYLSLLEGYATRMTDLPLAPEGGWESLYLAGDWTDAGDRDTITVENPYTRDAIASIPAGTEADVERAYETAASAQEAWAQQPPQARAGVINAAVQFVEDHRGEIAELLARESGSTRVKCEAELGTAIGMLQQAASYPFRMDGQHADSITPGKENVAERVPVGVVGVISPWNFPLHLSMRAVAPAIATGNAVVLKPASNTPITGGLLLARIFEAAGVPEASSASSPAAAPRSATRLPVTRSQGPSPSPARPRSDRGSPPRRPATAPYPRWNSAGTTSTSSPTRPTSSGPSTAASSAPFSTRPDLHLDQSPSGPRGVYDDYVDALADRAASLPTGDPTDDDTVIGPIIDESQRDQIVEYIEESVDAGATLETGGDHDGLVVEPTVLSDADNDMAAACNEHFGPVAPVIPYASDDEAIELANDTIHGLSGAVHSETIERARRIADGIETGMIHINDQPINDEPHVPSAG